MLQSDRVRVNGALERDAKRRLVPGDVVEIASKATPSLLPPELTVVYEDDHLIAVNKAAGLLTVSTAKERERTAQAFLNEYLRLKGFRDRIHVVHRLDRDTSGVMLFAKSFDVRQKLKDIFAAHDIDRVYHAIVERPMEHERGTFRSYLAEDDTFTVRSVASERKGKLAVTHYRVLRQGLRYAYLEVTLETGRKNQIRVHLSEHGHPVIGDERYGAQTSPIRRLGLHAHLIGFSHPVTGKKMTLTAPVPDSFRTLDLG